MKNCNCYQKEKVQLNNSLGIVKVSNMISVDETKGVPSTVHHVFCIDISGSMSSVLRQMREQLKAKLPEVVQNNDDITIIYFAQRSACGIVREFAKLTTADDIRELSKDIDKYLKPSGWTDFVPPLEITQKVINKMQSASSDLFNFVFLSDGGHNDSPWQNVVDELNNLKGKVSSATIIEFGNWADSNALQEMAETLGGSKIFDQDFDQYQVDIENILKSKTAPRLAFNISDFKSDMRLQLMFAIDRQTNSIKIYSTDRVEEIFIPVDTTELIYVSKSKGKSEDFSLKGFDRSTLDSLYASIYVYSCKLKYDIVESLLYSSRDKELIDLYCNSFGKQKLAEFQDRVLDRIFNPSDNIELTDSKYRPNPKRYCVMNFVDDIMNDDGKIYLFHPEFNYSRTGAKSITKKILTEDQKQRLSKVSTKLKADKILSEADANSPVMEIKDTTEGVSVNKLQWNKERANLSLQVSIDVNVKLPKNDVGIPEGTIIPSYIVRNYTLIKDGILNVTKLPLSISNKLAGKFKRMGLVESEGNGVYVINISTLPIINKRCTESVTSLDMAKLETELLENQCYLKYLSYLKTECSITNSIDKVVDKDKKSNWTKEQYAYLSSLGITNRGYSPKTELDYSGDFYMANTLKTSIEKFSSLPKIETIIEKNSLGKKLTAAEEYLYLCINNIQAKVKVSSEKFERVCELIDDYKKRAEILNREIAKNKFSIILSRKWFLDKNDFDDNQVVAKINGNDHIISWSFKETKVNL